MFMAGVWRFVWFGFALPLGAQSLETRVWNSTEMFAVEQEVVRRIQVNPSDSYAHYLLSVLKTRSFSENPTETTDQFLAIKLAQQSIDLNPDSDMGFMAMAHALNSMGRTKQAVTLMNRVLNAGTLLSWRYYFTLARISADHLEYERVLSLLKQSLDLQGAEHDIIMPFVIATLQQSDDDRKILTELKILRHQYPHSLLDYYVAVQLAKIQEYKTSHEMFLNLSQHDQWGIEAQLNAGMIGYQFLNKSAESRKIFESLLQNPRISRSHLADVHSHLGILALQKKDKTSSMDHFKKYLLLTEDTMPSLEFVISQNRNYSQGGSNVEIIRFLLDSIPPSGLLYAMLGEVLAEDAKNLKESEVAFLNAIVMNPERADFRAGLGIIYYKSKDYEKARSHFRVAVQLDPSNAHVMYNLACVLAITQKSTEAMMFLEESLSLDPNLVQIARTDEDLRSLIPLEGFRKLLQKHSH